MIEKIKGYYIVPALILIGVVFVTISFDGMDNLSGLISGFSNQPFFNSVDNFVLFGNEELKLEQGVQISSGDIGSNKDLDIQKDVIVNGNLFADKITIDKSSVINGNASFNKLQSQKETQILGVTTIPVSLPIASLPAISDFPIGTQDIKFTGTSTANVLNPGNYKDIIVDRNSRLTLLGGFYNLRKIELRENSVLIFATSTALNIKEELFAQQKVSILPDANVKFDDLKINYKSQKPTEFGKRSFLNFKLFAPNTQVHIGEEAIVRGQILAKKIRVEKNPVLSLEESFEKESDVAKIVQDQNGNRFFANEIITLFSDDATELEIKQIIESVGGIVAGIIDEPKIYKIQVNTAGAESLLVVIEKLTNLNNPLITSVTANFIGSR